MSIRGNSGFIDTDKRFGSPSGDTKGIIAREQHFLERTQGRFASELLPPTPTVWYDANSSYITTQGGPVRVDQWDDRSGNNINATGPGGTSDPIYNSTDSNFNNLASVEFESNDFLESADDALLDSTDGFVVYLVTKIDSLPSTFSFVLSFTNGTSWTQGWGMYYYAGTWRWFVNDWNTSSQRVEMGSWSDFTNTHIFKFKYDRTSISGEIIGPSAVSEVTTSYSSALQIPTSEGITFCYGGSSLYDANATVGEMLFYNSPLTPEEETQVEDYLKDKFNIS
jgi:hypothetical protein|tara:strand:+ start:192 stop:1034 length:843 start_codon:yes stop_codon:yes gene_type:complete